MNTKKLSKTEAEKLEETVKEYRAVDELNGILIHFEDEHGATDFINKSHSTIRFELYEEGELPKNIERSRLDYLDKLADLEQSYKYLRMDIDEYLENTDEKVIEAVQESY